MLRNSAKLISVRISTTYQDALKPEADSRPRWQFLNGRARDQSFLVTVGDVTVVLPAGVFSNRLHQPWERGALGGIDIGAALLAQPLGCRPRTPSLDGGCMLGGQFPREGKDEANAPAWSAVVRGGRSARDDSLDFGGRVGARAAQRLPRAAGEDC